MSMDNLLSFLLTKTSRKGKHPDVSVSKVN